VLIIKWSFLDTFHSGLEFSSFSESEESNKGAFLWRVCFGKDTIVGAIDENQS